METQKRLKAKGAGGSSGAKLGAPTLISKGLKPRVGSTARGIRCAGSAGVVYRQVVKAPAQPSCTIAAGLSPRGPHSPEPNKRHLTRNAAAPGPRSKDGIGAL